MSARLPRAIGIRKAKEMSLTGNYLTAREAERMGLVNRAVPKDQLMAAVARIGDSDRRSGSGYRAPDEAAIRFDYAGVSA